MIVLQSKLVRISQTVGGGGGGFGFHTNMATNEPIQAFWMFHAVLVYYKSIAYTEDQSQ